MKGKITKWGNSYGLRIPISLVKKLGWQDAEVEFNPERKGLFLSVQKKREKSLEDMARLITPQNKHAVEFDDEEGVGNEIW